MELDTYLDKLAGGEETVSRSGHLNLSSPSPEDLEVIAARWPLIPEATRREVLTSVSALAEDNIELDFTDVLRMALGDSSAPVREVALRGLWECEDRSLIRPLAKILTSDPDPSVRAAAAMALRPFAERAGGGRLIERDEARLRAALMEAIGRSGEDGGVVRRAIEAAGSLGGEDVAAVILDAAGSGDAVIRQSSIYAMGASGSSGWLPRLAHALDDPEPATRYEATWAMGRIGGEAVAARIIPMLDDQDPQVREAAAEALGMIGGQQARAALARCVEGPDEALSEAATAALESVNFENDPLGLGFQT